MKFEGKKNLYRLKNMFYYNESGIVQILMKNVMIMKKIYTIICTIYTKIYTIIKDVIIILIDKQIFKIIVK